MESHPLMAAIDGGYRRQLQRVLRAAVCGGQLRLLQKIYCLLSYSTTVTRLIDLHYYDNPTNVVVI